MRSYSIIYIRTFFWFDDFCGEIDVDNLVESYDVWQSDDWSFSVGDGKKPQAPATKNFNEIVSV